MVKVTVCIGSSCHLKGARQIVEEFQFLVSKNNLKEDIDLGGTFCMGKCAGEGVSVTVDDELYSLKKEDAKDFFSNVVMKKVK